MSENSGADRMVNVQLTARGSTALEVLKEQYGVGSKAAALEKLLRDHAGDAVENAEQMIAFKQSLRQGKPKKDKK